MYIYTMYHVYFLLTVLSVCNGAVDIKKYLKVCNRNSLEINDCMVEAVRDGINVMAQGIEELGVPPIDPYHQKELKVEYKNNQIFAKVLITNIYVEGLKNAIVKDARVRADEDKLHFEVDLTSPMVFVKGEYEGEGQYNALKVAANGEFNTTMTDLVYTWKIEGIPKKNGSEIYARIKSFYMRPDVGNMQTNFLNNNPDTRELTDLGTRFMNNNWRLLYRELLPFAQSNWDKIGTRVANKIFLKVPYDKIFPLD